MSQRWADSDAETSEILDFLYVYNISDNSPYVVKTIYHCSPSMNKGGGINADKMAELKADLQTLEMSSGIILRRKT